MGKKNARKNSSHTMSAPTPVTAATAETIPSPPTAPPVSVSTGASGGLPVLKRIELRQLVDSLLQMALIQTTAPADQWQQYVDMQTLLDRIRGIEAELRVRPAGGRQQRTQHIVAFKQWARDNGAAFDSVDIAEFAGYELGLVATRPIARDSLFVTVPQRMIMTVDNVSPSVRWLMRQLPMVEEMMSVRLAFSVLVERLDEQSFWRPYLNVLPERYSTVLAFSVNEMREMRGSSALPEALRQCRSIARQYAFFHKLVHREPAAGEEPADALVELLRERFTYELYCWAVSTVMTRQNSMPNLQEKPADDDAASESATATPTSKTARPALIPLWDMANHTDGRVTNVYSVAEQRVEGGALRDFAKGDQIFIYYGDRRNSNFLIHNGFVYADNRSDSVAVRLGLSATDPLLAERTQLLQSLSIGVHSELLVLPAPLHISGDMLAFVRIFNMNAGQLQHWLAAKNAADLRCVDCALDTELEQRTWTFLKVRFTLLLRAFGTTLAEDEASVEAARRGQNKLGFVRTMVVQYRVLEKRMLGAALEYVGQRTRQ